MTIDFHKHGKTLTVKPVGKLDTTNAPELDRQLQPRMKGIAEIIMDLEGVEYISSSGLRVLLAAEQEMEERDGEMRVIHVNSYVMEVLSITGFLDILNVE